MRLLNLCLYIFLFLSTISITSCGKKENNILKSNSFIIEKEHIGDYKCSNIIGIDDSSYHWFFKAQEIDNMNDEKSSAYLSEKIKTRSLNVGDKRGLIISKYVMMLHSVSAGKEKEFKPLLNEIFEICNMFDDMKYFYFSIISISNYYSNFNRLTEALETLYDFKTFLEKNDNAEGWVQYNRMMAQVYIDNGIKDKAKEYMMKAKDCLTDDMYGSLPSIVYRDYAMLFPASSDSCRIYLEKGLERSSLIGDSIICMHMLAKRYADINDKDNFNFYFDLTNKYYLKYNQGITKEQLHQIQAYDAAFKNDRQKALNYLDSISNEHTESSSIAHIRVYEILEDFKTAFYNSNKRYQETDSLNVYTIFKSLEEYDKKIKLEEENAKYNKMRLQLMYIILGLFILILILFLIVIYVMYNNSKHRKILIDNLEKARNEAEEANRMKEIFIHNMNHEIRTPMNAILGFSEILAEGAEVLTADERREFVDNIRNNATLFTMLVDDIIDLASMEGNNYKINKSMCQINSICKQAMNSTSHRLQGGVEMKFSTDLNDTCYVYTDGKRVQQILVNLLSNACKHTVQGEIRVSCTDKEKESMITFMVEDTGPGVPADKAEAIFERFVMLNKKVEGTGLGLNICRVLTNLLGGEVFLDTTYTSGARFILRIPKTTDQDIVLMKE